MHAFFHDGPVAFPRLTEVQNSSCWNALHGLVKAAGIMT